MRVGWSVELPAYLVLVAVTAPLTAVDLTVRKLPDRLLVPAAAAAIGLLAVAAVREGTWHAVGRALLAALLLAVIFLALAIAAGGSFGLGDVKLLAVSGLYLGYLGWRQVVAGVFATFLIAALAGVGVAIHTRQFAATTIALGPAILGGTLVSLLVP
jgi:leader peptidase (prepilin peptidase)/N-methyltransferase